MDNKTARQDLETVIRVEDLALGSMRKLRGIQDWLRAQAAGAQQAPDQTPAARWREAGEPDPHDGKYEGERASLCKGDMTDDELANEVYLDPNIGNLTAAKERIRWLSRKLESHHTDLLKIHRVTSGIAHVEPITEDDHLTVKRVKEMAQMINRLSDQKSGEAEPKPMIPVYQELLHDPEKENGDCFRACVATLLGLTLEQVPHFCRKGNDGNWFNEFQEWLKARGWTCFSVSSGDPDGWFMSVAMSDAVYLLAGPSPRFEGELHQVLARGGEIIHDPHPDNTGLLPPAEGEYWEATIVLPNKPFWFFDQLSKPQIGIPERSSLIHVAECFLENVEEVTELLLASGRADNIVALCDALNRIAYSAESALCATTPADNGAE
jgi:hypothetical protein